MIDVGLHPADGPGSKIEAKPPRGPVQVTGHMTVTTAAQRSVLSVAMENVGDAPACDVCGTITVRSGTCYKCLNCGNSMGCS